jgi:hypothetical protein
LAGSFFYGFLYIPVQLFMLFKRVHAGVPSTVTQNGPMLSEAAFVAAMKDYEEDDETEEDGEQID